MKRSIQPTPQSQQNSLDEGLFPPAALVMSRNCFSQIVRHVQDQYPLEACGMLAGSGEAVTEVIPVENILRSPTAFEMEPRQQVRAMLDLEARGLQLLAIYHSHPGGPQVPSPTDVAKAYYPETIQLIVSLAQPAHPVARAFTIVNGRIDEVALRIEQL